MSSKQAIALTATGIAFAATVLGAPAVAQASSGQLSITAVASPVWTAGRDIPVSVTVRNADAQVFCDPIRVTTTWVANGSRHVVSMGGVSPAGVFTGAATIPARATRSGTVKYRVAASQVCGLLQRTTTYAGHTGWRSITIA